MCRAAKAWSGLDGVLHLFGWCDAGSCCRNSRVIGITKGTGHVRFHAGDAATAKGRVGVGVGVWTRVRGGFPVPVPPSFQRRPRTTADARRQRDHDSQPHSPTEARSRLCPYIPSHTPLRTHPRPSLVPKATSEQASRRTINQSINHSIAYCTPTLLIEQSATNQDHQLTTDWLIISCASEHHRDSLFGRQHRAPPGAGYLAHDAVAKRWCDMEVGKGKNPADSGDMEVPHTDTGHAFAGNIWHCRAAVQWPERSVWGDAKVRTIGNETDARELSPRLTCPWGVDSTALDLRNHPCKCRPLNKRDGLATSRLPSSSTTMRP
jgi:hypothetical protein